MAEVVDVLSWLTGPHEPDVVARLSARGVRVVRRCADLTELVAAAEAGVGQVAVLALGRGVDRSRLGVLRRCGVRTVLVADPARVPAALALGADAVVAEDDDVADRLATVVADLATRAPDAGTGARRPDGPSQDGERAENPDGVAAGTSEHRPSGLPGRLVVVWGPCGSTGRTSVAVHLASELAATASTVLVDADSVAPSIPQTLGVTHEVAALPALCRAAGQGVLGPDVLRRRARALPDGVVLVSGLTRADRWRELDPDHLEVVWATSRRVADWTVVDVAGGLEAAPARGADRAAATRSALHAADHVLVVSGADPVSVRRTVLALDDLRAEGVTASVHVVVNRLRSARLGRGALVEAFERLAGCAPVVLVPQDGALDDAMLAGRSLREVGPRSGARRALVQLATQLTRIEGADAPGSGRRTGSGSARRGRRRGSVPRRGARLG